MPMLDEKSRAATTTTLVLPSRSERKQRQQTLVAIALLLAALILVLYKDWQFWFPSPNNVQESSTAEPANSPEVAAPIQVAKTQLQVPVAPKTSEHVKAATAREKIPEPLGPIVTNRAVLPPLEVEVVAGDQRRTVQPSNPSVKVDLAPSVSAFPQVSSPSAATTNASERVRLSPDTVQVVSRPVQPNYPMLAKQMKVQGSVVLQALIGKDGNIQDLHVISGPAILSSAAMDAVRQWRFKPYFQGGSAVETQANITVNFTISTN